MQAHTSPAGQDEPDPSIEATFTALYAAHARGIRTHLQRMVREAGAVDDLAQEAFLRAWTGLAALRNRAAARAWLYRIATNCALNYVRSARFRRHLSLDPAPQDEEDEEAQIVPSWMIDVASLAPAEQLAAKEALRALERATSGLRPDKQEVVRLVQREGMSIREAARSLGIPEGTVKSRLHYALRQIEVSLREMEERDEHGS